MLVLNWHEPYICLYAAMGHQFDVAPPPQNPGKRWNQGFRPLPDNVTEISWESAEEGARAGRYDLFIGLTLQDVHTGQEWDLPRLFVMLNMIGTDAGLDGAEKEAYVERLRPFFREVDISFISEKKRRNWGWEAPVVVSGIDPGDYGGFTGEDARVLRVGNMLKERDHMQGFGIQEEILGGDIPSAIVGVNPTIPESHASESWEDLKEQYQQNRVLLCTLTNGHEDGYNLAILEAMATGMPVVSIANSSSPIIDGYNGFISDDYDYLREKLRLLLADRELAAELGCNARQTVVEKFHIRDCAAAWEEVFADTVGRWRERRQGTAAPAV
ncbi:MAG: glycosyltransferase family 4 protein, partial [Gemmatimonadetes bacterium]|nr:glycosyltransferase family 4 protein [Gemmatimonadota bacterium]